MQAQQAIQFVQSDSCQLYSELKIKNYCFNLHFVIKVELYNARISFVIEDDAQRDFYTDEAHTAICLVILKPNPAAEIFQI